MDLFAQIKKSFPEIEKLLYEKNQIISFLDTSYSELYLYHFGLGTWMRNHLLAEKSELFHSFKECGIIDKDEMSSLIIKLFYLYEQKKQKAEKPL